MRTGSRGEPISPFARLERAKLPTERTAASQPSSLALPSVLWQEPQRRALPALLRELRVATSTADAGRPVGGDFARSSSPASRSDDTRCTSRARQHLEAPCLRGSNSRRAEQDRILLDLSQRQSDASTEGRNCTETDGDSRPGPKWEPLEPPRPESRSACEIPHRVTTLRHSGFLIQQLPQ
jgi:hypothetical protein